MRKDSKLSDVLHVLLHMADQNGPLSSDFLAKMMQTNPVVVRRILGGLRQRGLVASTKGRTGGWRLTCRLSEVSLLQIYEAVGQPQLFAIGFRQSSDQCLVNKAVNEALTDCLEEAQALLLQRFAGITLQTLYESFGRDMAAIRATLGIDQRRVQ